MNRFAAVTSVGVSIAVLIAVGFLWTLQGFSTENEKLRSKLARKRVISQILRLADSHELADVLSRLIRYDGAGSWPPNTNHNRASWPVALRPYKDIYFELAPLLPQEIPSLDDVVNRARIDDFRSRFRKLLTDRIELDAVITLLRAADEGRMDVLPRDVYNAFYCCIASSRHAYRWATMPVVRIAQQESVVNIPQELVVPWTYLQRYYGCESESGNNTSNLVLNFDENGQHVYWINTGMAPIVLRAEEEFARIFYEIECAGVPVLRDMIYAAHSFAQGDKRSCAKHMASISTGMRSVMQHFFDRLHNLQIPRSIWLQRVQGFYAWGAGDTDPSTGEYEKFDGLSGNQIMLFQLLDAFLGLPAYLSVRDRQRNMPRLQREAAKAFEKFSFRVQLQNPPRDEYEAIIAAEFENILKRMRMFRQVHRSRAKNYLAYPAPERLTMTAGKGVLKPTIEQSLQFLDEFMVRRISQTM